MVHSMSSIRLSSEVAANYMESESVSLRLGVAPITAIAVYSTATLEDIAVGSGCPPKRPAVAYSAINSMQTLAPVMHVQHQQLCL